MHYSYLHIVLVTTAVALNPYPLDTAQISTLPAFSKASYVDASKPIVAIYFIQKEWKKVFNQHRGISYAYLLPVSKHTR